MGKRFSGLVAILMVLLFLVSCNTVQLDHVDMVPIDQGNTKVVEDGDMEYLSSTGRSGFEIAMLAVPDASSGLIELSIGLENPTDEDIDFSLGCFSLYKGNSDTGEWAEIMPYVEEEEKSGGFGLAFLGALSFLSNPVGTVTGIAVGSAVNALAPHVASVTAEMQAEIATALSPAIAVISSSLVDEDGEEIQLTPYERKFGLSLGKLHDETIEAGTAYRGLLYFEPDRKSPDYKVVYTCDEGFEREFVFQRSDRASVINPWLDQTRSRVAITLGHAVNGDRFSVTVTGVNYRGLSAYGILSFTGFLTSDRIQISGSEAFLRKGFDNVNISQSYIESNGYGDSWDFHGEATGREFRKSVGIGAGFSYNAFPYTTFILGSELFFDSEQFVEAKLSYRESEDGEVTTIDDPVWLDSNNSLGIGFNAGALFITNFLAFNLILTYRIPNSFYVDAGIGFAF